MSSDAFPGWAERVDRAGGLPAASALREAVVAAARRCLEQPLVRRVYRFEDIGRHRTWLDGRTASLEGFTRELFGLAMSDHGACSALAGELPLVAAAWRLTGSPELLARALEQLEEVSTWTPLQRPGWSCCGPGTRVDSSYRDGGWLATGTGVRAIANALDLLAPPRPAPSGRSGGPALPPALRERLVRLLEAEIAGVVDDWRTARPWFVKERNAITNQWVLPTEGLVRACLVAGRRRHAEAYELGVGNLLEALNTHGRQGEFEEGLHYAMFTVGSFLHAAFAMALEGDRRALDHPYLRRFPAWAVHHLQPGGMGINAFDAFSASPLPPDHPVLRELLSLTAAVTGDSSARWALGRCLTGPTPDMPGLAAAALPAVDASAEPPLFAAYERATRVNWRSAWTPDATGIWVRGGHPTDQHDHQDRGHVSFVLRGRPVLIETGTPAYHHPGLPWLFASGAGHNVLQVGLAPAPEAGAARQAMPPGWQLIHRPAPMTVQQLDGSGGSVTVDGTACYEGVRQWRREARWTADSLAVRDEVELGADTREIIVFRWHLAAREGVTIEGGGAGFRARWPGVTLRVTGSAPLLVSSEERENHTIEARDWDDPRPYPRHRCLIIRTAEPVHRLALSIEVEPDPP